MQQSCPGFFDIGDQAETCAQLFYVKERFYGFEKTLTFDEHGDKLVMGYLLQTEKKCFKRSTLLLFYTLD